MSTDLRTEIKSVLREELGDLLDDVAWRIRHLTDLADKVSAERMNLNTHMLTGYIVLSDSPVAGSIEWDDLYVVYQGTQYGPFAGDTTDKYVWFDQDHPTDKIQTSNAKPTLTPDDAILFVNNNGTVVEVLKSQLIDGALLIDGTVDSSELADAAVVASKIFDGAITSTKIDDGAVVAGKIASGAVTSTELDDGAVTEPKIGSGAVTTAKIGSGAVGSSQLADGAVETAKIADGAVGGAKITDGGVNTSKLNTLMHMLF